jgi:phage shock protein C
VQKEELRELHIEACMVDKGQIMNGSGPLRRSADDRMIAGVCAGLAEYFGMDPTLVRVGYVLLSVLSVGFPGMLVYLILWLVIPERKYY